MRKQIVDSDYLNENNIYQRTLGDKIIEKLKVDNYGSGDYLRKLYYTKKYARKLQNNLGSDANFTGIPDQATFVKQMFSVLNAFRSGDFVLPNQSTTQLTALLSAPGNVVNARVNIVSSSVAIIFPFRQTFNITYTPNNAGDTNKHYFLLGLTTLPSINAVSPGDVSPAEFPWINSINNGTNAFSPPFTSTLINSDWAYGLIEPVAGNVINGKAFFNPNINAGTNANQVGVTSSIGPNLSVPQTFEISIQSKTGADFAVMVKALGGPNVINLNNPALGVPFPQSATYFFFADYIITSVLAPAQDQVTIQIAGLNSAIAV